MRTKFERKRYSKTSHKRPPPDVKCGEWITMDIVSRSADSTSIEYIDGTGRKRGGGRHALVGMCEASSNLWFLPVSKKSEVEQAVQNMIAHIEIEMRKSCDHDGGKPKVKRAVSYTHLTLPTTPYV